MSTLPPEQWQEISPYLDEALSLDGNERNEAVERAHKARVLSEMQTREAQELCVDSEQALSRTAERFGRAGLNLSANAGSRQRPEAGIFNTGSM